MCLSKQYITIFSLSVENIRNNESIKTTKPKNMTKKPKKGGKDKKRGTKVHSATPLLGTLYISPQQKKRLKVPPCQASIPTSAVNDIKKSTIDS